MQNEPIAIIGSQYPRVVIPLIDSAIHTLDVIVFDWRQYKNQPANPVSLFNSSIARASSRGVSVRCLVNNDDIIQMLKSIGCKARKVESTKLLHTKLLIIDKKKVVIGSHNFSQNAFSMNEEASIFVNMNDENNEFVKYFNNLFGI